MTKSEENTEKSLKDRVYELYKAGYTRQNIADMTGYCKGYVDMILRQMNGVSKRRVINEEQKNTILSLKKAGKKLREISEEVGFSQSAVQKCIKDSEQEEKQNNPEVVEDDPVPVKTATRKPQEKITYVNGKRYRDVSEFYLGI